MAKRHLIIWREIKTTGKATITVSKAAARLTENGVKEEKTKENRYRLNRGKIGWSKLVVHREEISDSHVKITFSLLYSTEV